MSYGFGPSNEIAADAIITDLVTGKVMKVDYGQVSVTRVCSHIYDPIAKKNPDLVSKIYDYDFIRFKTRVFKKYLRKGYPFKLAINSGRVCITATGGLKELPKNIGFVESTGKRVPYSPKLLAVSLISNIEACDRIEKFRP